MKMPNEVLHGVLGEAVRAIEPHSEADPWAVLMHLLAYVGNVVGRKPYYLIEATRHHPNLFIVLVGPTSTGRKGTAAGYPRALFRKIDPAFVNKRFEAGLSSGEGVINAIRDQVKGTNKKGEEVVIDVGVKDKRLMVQDGEFANTLKVMSRPGNTLSPVIRNAWDGSPLGSLTKNSNISCEEPHVSIVGHITKTELTSLLTSTEVGNGFGNRFLFCSVARSKLLPFGGDFESSQEFGVIEGRLRTALIFAKNCNRVKLSKSARDHWTILYHSLSLPGTGVVGSLSARAAPQILRLALIYALMDQSYEIRVPHLEAAEKIWDKCMMSLSDIFGDSFCSKYSESLLQFLEDSSIGRTRTEIRDFLNRNASSGDIEASLNELHEARYANSLTIPTSGRPYEVWYATIHKQTTYDFYDINDLSGAHDE